jgi:hypothetical protein
MRKKRVFASFDVDHDEDLRNLLIVQSQRRDSEFELADWSVKEPMTDQWKELLRARIRRVDLLIVICGEHTGTAADVAAELLIAQQEKKNYILLMGRADKACKKPAAAKDADKIYSWTWESLTALIAGAR